MGSCNGGNKLSSCIVWGDLLGGKTIDTRTWIMESYKGSRQIPMVRKDRLMGQ